MLVIESVFCQEKALQLLAETVESHRTICNKLDIHKDYKSALSGDKNIGGNDPRSSQDHFLARYLNSAARTQLAIQEQHEEFIPLKYELLAQLLEGVIYIIDIGAGNGAGITSIINAICVERDCDKYYPSLDIEIHAVDYSEHSLDYFESILNELDTFHKQHGLKIRLNKHVVDLTDDIKLKDCIAEIKSSIGENPRYLLTTSAISGVKYKKFCEKFQESYNYLTKQFNENNSTFFWVEPFTKNKWIYETWGKIADAVDKTLDDDDCNAIRVSFCWADPYIDEPGNLIETGADFLLLGLSNE